MAASAKAIEITNLESITSLSFRPDVAYFVSADCTGSIRHWSASDGVEVSSPVMKAGGQIHAVVVSTDGRWILSGGSGKTVTIWSTETQQKALEVREHTADIYALDVSSDSMRFASGSGDKTVQIFDITSGIRLAPPLQHEVTVSGVKFSPDGSRIATAVHRCSFIGVYDAHSASKLFEIPIAAPSWKKFITPLAWSSDGQRLFLASPKKIICFDTSTSSRSEWSVHGGGKRPRTSIVASSKFIACSVGTSVSFWDSTSHKQIGPVIEHTEKIDCIAISHDARYLACGHATGIVVRGLEEILPQSYLRTLGGTSSIVCVTWLPLMKVTDTVLKAWVQGNPAKAVATLSDEIAHSFHLTRRHDALATRALIRTHLGEWRTALEDAEMSLQIKRSTIGKIARSIALVGVGEQEAALDDFGLVFCDCDSSDIKLLSVINSILLFVCNKRKQAISRLCHIIDACDEKMKEVCLQVLGMMYLKQGDYENAVKTLDSTNIPFTAKERGPLMTIFIIFNWNFENLKFIAWKHLCETLSASGSTREVGDALLKMVAPLPEDEREHAYGRILQEIITQSGQVTLLAWTGKSSACNSCLPSSPAAYAQTSAAFLSPGLQGEALRMRTEALRQIVPLADALMIYGAVSLSQPVRFANFHLHLPCIVFRVKSLRKERGGVYHAQTAGLGDVNITTADSLPLKEPEKLVLVNPWIHDLLQARGAATWGDEEEQGSDIELITRVGDNGSDADADSELVHESMIEEASTPVSLDADAHTQALQLIARLGQPFPALLLLKQPHGAFKRVAADHDIVVRGIEDDFVRNVCVQVLEVL